MKSNEMAADYLSRAKSCLREADMAIMRFVKEGLGKAWGRASLARSMKGDVAVHPISSRMS